MLRYLILIKFLFFSYIASQASNAIDLGISAAFSGPNKNLGINMKNGMLARFTEENNQNGIKGKKINLIALDDSYQPENAKINTLKLIKKHKVSAIIGNVGTPTSVIAAKIANNHKTIFYGAYTGSNLIRNSDLPFVFHYRASYEQELNVIINDIIKNKISFYEVGFFLQNDGYGRSVHQMAKKILTKIGFRNINKMLTSYYDHNSIFINKAIIKFLSSDIKPKAVIMASSYKASAEFINKIKIAYPDILFYNISFNGMETITKLISNIDYESIYLTQVTPPIPKAFAKKYQISQQNKIWFEGYIIADIMIKILKKITGEITSEKIKKAFERSKKFNTKFHKSLSFSIKNHQASNQIWLMKIDKNKNWQEVVDE